MLRSLTSRSIIQNNSLPQINVTQMSVLRSLRLKKNAAQQFANDGTGNHTHIVKHICQTPICDKQVCPALCSNLDKTTILGHNTHKPQIGRLCRFIAEEDAYSQYFVPANNNKIMTVQQQQQHVKDIKVDPKQQNFVNKYINKYDED